MSDCRDPAIKLFGKNIALPWASEGGRGDDDTGSPSKGRIGTPDGKDQEQESPTSGELATSSCDQASETDQPKSDEEKTLKKPDKILPCPRCNSMDTKFCYYNNYNVNQPRHFCKNCQRYWTAGGTMRNVPVGAGRRRNKNSAAADHYRQLTITEAALQAFPDAPNPNGTVLSFGSESTATVQSTGSSNSADDNGQGFAPLPYMSVSPWPYPWNPPPGASSFPIPMYPAMAYWGCGPWSMPWLSPPLASPPAASVGSSCSGPNSPTLGKHSRDGDADKQGEKCLWIPKTLRLDDPDGAAKSSIWATMGFKNDKAGADGLFKPFQTATVGAVEAAQLMHANPAALSRSINFQESSQW